MFGLYFGFGVWMGGLGCGVVCLGFVCDVVCDVVGGFGDCVLWFGVLDMLLGVIGGLWFLLVVVGCGGGLVLYCFCCLCVLSLLGLCVCWYFRYYMMLGGFCLVCVWLFGCFSFVSFGWYLGLVGWGGCGGLFYFIGVSIVVWFVYLLVLLVT